MTTKYPTMITTREEDHTYRCHDCEERFEIWDMGYIGPRDPKDERCTPFMPWLQLCKECEERRNDAD